MTEDEYRELQKKMDDKFEAELEEQFKKIVNNPSPSIEDLWTLPEEYFYVWRRKYDYPKLIESLNKNKPNFVKWKSEFNINDEEIIAHRISSFLKHKGPVKDKTLYLMEQTFDERKRLIVAHADLSKREVIHPDRGEAYVLIKTFISYSDWCDKKKIEFDLFKIVRRQAPNHKLERVWLDTGYELLKMGGNHPPVNGFGILLRGKHLEFVNVCGLSLEGKMTFGSEGNLEMSYCAVDSLVCKNLDLHHLRLWYCTLGEMNMSNSEISQWIFWKCEVTGDIINSKLRAIRIFGGKFTPYIKDTQLIKVEADHKGLPNSGYNYTYSILKKIFDNQGNDDEAGKYYIKEKELSREYSKGWKYILKSISYYYWMYGKKPERVIYVSVGIIFLSALIYWFFPAGIKPIEESKGFLDSIYFSVVTFTTLGYGDLSPVGSMRIVALLEAFFGALSMGFLVAGFSRAKY
ncbi:MAG TPA: potassium channel family protein [Puia sp.]